MQTSIHIMVDRITGLLSGNTPSIYLFGSVVLDDFKLGWSDIDIVCLTEKEMTEQQAEELVGLRQSLLLD
jgi:predicted nucleotidyltransferase